jgi:hypothetical protein
MLLRAAFVVERGLDLPIRRPPMAALEPASASVSGV